MEIKEPKFKVGDKVIDILNNEQLIVSEIIYYRFYDDNYLYVLNFNDGERFGYEDELHLTPYIEKPNSVWDLKERDDCYSLTICGNVHHGFWDGSSSSIAIRELGELFLTREEAECEIERRKVETEMLRLGGRREFRNGENNYYIVCDFDSNYAIDVFNSKSDGFAQMMIYFDSAKECRNAIETIGEDRIKKYIFKLGISCTN